MNTRTILQNALDAVFANKRRTTITIVSLAWAVASFLILMSYGQGFDVALRSAFQAVGQDLVIVGSGQTSEQAGGMRSGRRIVLERDDVDAIRESCPFVSAISPEIMQDAAVVFGSRQKEYMIRAVLPEYQRIRNLQIVQGRWLNGDDERYSRRVAVIGSKVARELFGSRPPIDAEITVNGLQFTVIGTLETKVQLANYNRPDNECLFIPYAAMQLFRSVRYPDLIVWAPSIPEVRDRAVKQVRSTLAGIHRFSPTDEKAVEIMAFSQFIGIIDGMSIALNALLIFIGLVTLGIGAVGLANIMFSAVLERTREIGVLKALGARRKTILAQFLWESIFVVLMGGGIGVLLGVVIAYSVGSLPFMGVMLGEELSQTYGRIHFQISAISVAVSLGVLFAVGLIAGMLPAIRASRLDPVESLHYE
jgi:putative ABC transport system permease protein